MWSENISQDLINEVTRSAQMMRDETYWEHLSDENLRFFYHVRQLASGR